MFLIKQCMWEFWHYFLKRILLSRKISFALITEVIIYISCFTFMNYAVTEFIFANACVEKINDTRWGVINQTFLYGPWGQILSLYLPFLLKATDKQMGSSAFCCFFTKWHGWLRGCPVSVSVAMTTFCIAVSTRQALRSWGPLSSCAVTLEGSSVVCLVSGRCKSHRKVRSLDLQNGMFTHQLAIPPRSFPMNFAKNAWEYTLPL